MLFSWRTPGWASCGFTGVVRRGRASDLDAGRAPVVPIVGRVPGVSDGRVPVAERASDTPAAPAPVMSAAVRASGECGVRAVPAAALAALRSASISERYGLLRRAVTASPLCGFMALSMSRPAICLSFTIRSSSARCSASASACVCGRRVSLPLSSAIRLSSYCGLQLLFKKT